jgi:hypothetical protein
MDGVVRYEKFYRKRRELVRVHIDARAFVAA